MYSAGVDEDDKLDRKAAGKVLRRAAAMLGPYRREVTWSGVLVVVSTLAVLAGPFLLKFGIDHGIKPGNTRALDGAVAAYVVVAIVAQAAQLIGAGELEATGIGDLVRAILRSLGCAPQDAARRAETALGHAEAIIRTRLD